jgi:hypothetical protein
MLTLAAAAFGFLTYRLSSALYAYSDGRHRRSATSAGYSGRPTALLLSDRF